MNELIDTDKISKTKNYFVSLLWKFLLIALLVMGVIFYWNYYNVYSDGERTGVLTKFSRKGNFFKTYEGEMMIGNITQTTSGLANEKFYFSVNEKSIADTLSKIQGLRVTLQYKQYRKSLFWRGDNQYIITGYSRVGQ